MVENKVTFYNNNLAEIDKNGYIICIAKSELGYIVVFKPCINYEGTKFVALVHKIDDEEAAYKKFMYVVAKMCRKDVTSKYFANTLWPEHLNNGSELSDIEKTFVTDFVAECCNVMHKERSKYEN